MATTIDVTAQHKIPVGTTLTLTAEANFSHQTFTYYPPVTTVYLHRIDHLNFRYTTQLLIQEKS